MQIIVCKNQLTDDKRGSFWLPDYGYGLGQRCPKDESKTDFGRGVAAGAYYAIDRKNRITVYPATHVFNDPRLHEAGPSILPIIQDIFK